MTDMKCRFLSLIASGLLLCSCNHIPNNSVFEPIDTKKLASIMKRDTLFISFYEGIREETENFNDIEKARFNDITYRRLYAVFEFLSDTNEMNPIRRQWAKQWEDTYGMYGAKADSVIGYWTQYKKDHSLDRFVKIEFAGLDKEFYSYSNDVKNVNFAFKLTPLQGKIDQIRFNYRYTAKINDVNYAEKHNCILTSPFSVPVTRYWEAEYSDEKRLKYTSSSVFRRDYDICFEITEVRKNGRNYSVDDLKIPETVEAVLDTDSVKYPYLYNTYKKDIVTNLLCPDYQEEYVFTSNRTRDLLQKKFPKEAAFMEYMDQK